MLRVRCPSDWYTSYVDLHCQAKFLPISLWRKLIYLPIFSNALGNYKSLALPAFRQGSDQSERWQSRTYSDRFLKSISYNIVPKLWLSTYRPEVEDCPLYHWSLYYCEVVYFDILISTVLVDCPLTVLSWFVLLTITDFGRLVYCTWLLIVFYTLQSICYTFISLLLKLNLSMCVS